MRTRLAPTAPKTLSHPCLARAALSVAVALFGIPTALAQDRTQTKNQWIPLFNGRNLDGWTVKIKGYPVGENYGTTFRVEGGLLKVKYDQYDRFDERFGHLFTKQPYSHYRLRVEYRFVGEQVPGGPPWGLRNSGAMIHSQSAESMRQDQSFPVSIEVQYLGGINERPRPTGNVCTPGTHIVMDGKLITQHCTESRSKTYRGDQWVTVEAEVHGNGKIRHFVNGELVLEYETPQLDESDEDARKLIAGRNGDKILRDGYIALQAESHPIEFRKVEIMPLPE
jgi:hypothetical protein